MPDLSDLDLQRQSATRRSFLRYTSAGIASVAAMSLLAACGGDDDDDGDTGAAENTPDEESSEDEPTEGEDESEEETEPDSEGEDEPTDEEESDSEDEEEPSENGDAKSGGALRVAFAEEPKNIHTQIDSGTEGVYVGKQIYDGLLNIDANGEIVPGLAVDFPEQPDDRTYIFTLREGVTFHNGEPFSAADVIWTFDRLLGKVEDLQSTQATRFQGIIESYEETAENEITFVLQEPWADFLTIMAGDKYLCIMQSDAELDNPEEYGQSVVVGTGPFKFKEWVKGDHLTLERNEEYWGDAPYLDEIVYQAIPEEATRMAAFDAGEIDVLLAPALKDVSNYEDNEDYNVLTADGGNMKLFVMNTSRDPFTDKNVRQAMYYGINRQEIIEAIYYGYATVGQSILPPWNEAHNPDLIYYDYDPDRATELLAEAGYADGLEFEVITTDATEFVDLSTLIQAQLEQIGVRMSITTVDKSAFAAETFPVDGEPNPNFQAFVYRLIYGFPTSDYGWRTFHPDSALDMTGYNQEGGAQNEEVPPLLTEAQQTLDVEDQQELYTEISDLILDDAVQILIGFQKNVVVTRAAVQDMGVTVISNMPLSGVWLDE